MGFVLQDFFFFISLKEIANKISRSVKICKDKLNYIYYYKKFNNILLEIAKKKIMICENLERQAELYL